MWQGRNRRRSTPECLTFLEDCPLLLLQSCTANLPTRLDIPGENVSSLTGSCGPPESYIAVHRFILGPKGKDILGALRPGLGIVRVHMRHDMSDAFYQYPMALESE